APKQRDQHGERRGPLFEQLMHDLVGVANDGVDEADNGAQLGNVGLAPRKAKRVFDASFYLHHFQQGMVEQSFEIALDQGLEIPELVGFHQVRVVVREEEVRVVFKKEVGDVVQMDQAVKFRRPQLVLLAEFITKQSGGLVHRVDQLCIFWGEFSRMMVD